MCGHPVVTIPLGKEAAISPRYVFGIVVENQMIADTWVCFWVLYSIPLVYASVFKLVL
jgi:hypothetical protein